MGANAGGLGLRRSSCAPAAAASVAMMTEPLDISAWQAIRALQQPGGPDLVAQVMTTYLNHVPPQLDAMRNAASQRDWSGVARCAHTLKSSSSQIGAQRLADICGVLERAARNGEVESFSEMLLRISQEYAAVCARLNDELRGEEERLN